MVRLSAVILSILLLSACGETARKDLKAAKTDPIGLDLLIEKAEINIIPAVRNLNFHHPDSLSIIQNNALIVYDDVTLSGEASYLSQLFQQTFNFDVETKYSESPVFHEGYLIDIKTNHYEGAIDGHFISANKDQLTIHAGSAASIFNGIQTLRQLIPFDQYKKRELKSCTFPAFDLADKPVYQWRGMLLDVCRHYFPKETVKKYIDLLAYYKFNVLHWHLTEDQAWRIEIKKYPKLTEVGAWRLDSSGNKYGGYYTQEDIKEIVAYAQERHIMIVPEIEMPGHSQAALAAYPHLACSEGPFEVANDWGVFKEIYCPTDTTFAFLEDVMDEVTMLFPSPYVHIGGDEAPKVRWEESNYCQNLLKNEGLKDYEELQAWFINRMANYLAVKDKKIIGWDEILNPKLNQEALVQVWRNQKSAQEAAKRGHWVIVSPTSHCYLDYGLDRIDVDKLYQFDPLGGDSETYEKGGILGGEVNMWTEHVPNDSVLDSKVFPRLLAASEVFWGTNTNVEDFYTRLSDHYEKLDNFDVKYGAARIPFKLYANASKSVKGGYGLEISAEKMEKVDLKIQSPGRWTDWEVHKNPFIPVGEDRNLIVQAYRGGRKYGEPVVQSYVAHKAHAQSNVSIDYLNEGPSQYYLADLLDGKKGSKNFRDGNWQGHWGNDVNLTIELDSMMELSQLKFSFYQYTNAWIFFPKSYSISISEDGKHFFEAGSDTFDKSRFKTRGKIIEDCVLNFDKAKVKFVRFEAQNIGKVPNWHEAAGEPAWVFIDEIEMY